MVLYEARNMVAVDTMPIAYTEVVLPTLFVYVGTHNKTILVAFAWVIRDKPFLSAI